MNQIKTLFVVSLLLTCMYIPCIAAAGNNEGPSGYDAKVNKTIGQAQAANVRDGHAGVGPVADAQVMMSASRGDLERAREIYRNNRTPENQQMLMDVAKDHLLQMLDLMIERLELLQEQIKFSEDNSIVPDGASENINRYKLRIESYEQEIESAGTAEDISSVARSIDMEWRSIHMEILHYTKYLIAVRIEQYIKKADTTFDRLDVKIRELKYEGVDTTNLRQKLNDFNATLTCVEENYELAKGAASDEEMDPVVRQHIQNAERCIVETNQILRAIFKELGTLESHRNGAVILNGTGTLKASGSGTAWIQGSPDLALSCDYGTLMVRDPMDDTEIKVKGNGGNDQFGRWMMYHGFKGTADIAGSDVSVVLVGSGVDLTVTGTGRVMLVGDGTYQVRGADGEVLSSGDWQEQRDGYEIGIDASVFDEAEHTGSDSADEAEDEPAANETVNESADEPANESDSETDEVGDDDADTSVDETGTESETTDSGIAS